MLHDAVPSAVRKSAVVRDCMLSGVGSGSGLQAKVTLDTGADSGNYIGEAALQRLSSTPEREPCRHRIRLGDGETMVNIQEMVQLDVRLEDDYGDLGKPISTVFYVVPTLGAEAIIGLHDILGNYYESFLDYLHAARETQRDSRERPGILSRLGVICDRMEVEMSREVPRSAHIRKLRTDAKKEASTYLHVRRRVEADRFSRKVYVAAPAGTVELIQSPRYGSVYADHRVENILAAIEATTALEFHEFPTGSVLDPWAEPAEACPEETETPDPLAFGEDVLRFMEMSVEEAKREYFELLPNHISKAMMEACPQVMDLMRSEMAQEIFAPSSWPGMKVPPAVMDVVGTLPTRLTPRARPIRPALYEAAKKEFDRLRQYFYVDSRSPIASPLVIAPKATAPFIRYCGDYREVNKLISIPQQPIPIVQHELVKASHFRVYVDLDMANSFHQIPLGEEFSNLLSVQTPWGLVRPKFLPEGVGPASGLLQHLVRGIFEPFAAWTIVIFDNFLVLADDYQDAYNKLKLVLEKCREVGIVLKLKKSFIGVEEATFFGYHVTHGSWEMSGARKDAISVMSFPRSIKEMQSFLGAALFFHNHIPDYSAWTARLYEMTHIDFVWDPGQWTYDYEGQFERFKAALREAAKLHFPDYSLPWVLRVDASEFAVGAVLFQECPREQLPTSLEVLTNTVDTVSHQPIAFSSKRFSNPATKWDAYKREAYAIFHGVFAFAYYLRGKSFLVETDHRNLQWIEASHSPIVVRWRTLLQNFSFLIRHIPGKSNGVADWLSRMGSFRTDNTTHSNTEVQTHARVLNLEGVGDQQPPSLVLADILSSVHGGRRLHFGAYETWRRAKLAYPGAHISIAAVRDWVQQCPVCQKVRDVGIRNLPAETLSLKPPTYRRTVGVDHLSVAPDASGNTCVVMVVEHYSHLPVAYAAKSYSAEELAGILFKHFVTYGLFDELASDPGSAMMADVVAQLNRWLGVRHKVSLVDRHESNGCEGSNRQFLRHLRTLLADTRLHSNWSSDEVLPVINFEMASYPTTETGGFTPFQLKYGTQDAAYFRLPEGLAPGAQAAELLKRLDANIAAVRETSTKLQADIAAERAAADGPTPKYEPGDLVLWNSKSTSGAHLEDKRLGAWMGPYQVVRQSKNDITVRHLAVDHERVIHTSRVRPYIGLPQAALELAKLDYNQWTIKSINYWAGNVHHRSTLTFNVTFEDGDTVDLPFTADLAQSVNFEQYVAEQPGLAPLLFSSVEAKRRATQARKLAITVLQPGDVIFLDLRYYDGSTSQWFDSLLLPPTNLRYMVEGRVTHMMRGGKQLMASVMIYGSTVTLDNVDIDLYSDRLLGNNILLTFADRLTFPRVWMD